MNFKSSPTPYVVGALIGTALLITAIHLAGWVGGAALGIILSYEGWTLINSFPNDTISEIIWKLSKRPWIPWLFGFATAWMIASGRVTDPYLVLTIGFLSGHFFFQKMEE
jgi:hypothetical protein